MESKQLKIEDLISEGYQLRPVRMEDLEAVVALINAVSQHFMGENQIDEGELRTFWSIPDLKMEEDIRLLVAPDGKAVGYVECVLVDDPPVHPGLWMQVHPDYLDAGIDEVLLAWAEEHAKLALECCPAGLRVSIGTFNPNKVEPMARLLETHGYKLIRHSLTMRIQLEQEVAEPQWPAGIELRPFVAEHDLVTVYKTYDEAFSDHYGHIDRPLEVGLKRFRHMLIEDEAHDPSLWFVAWDGDEVAGISLCFKYASEDRDMGWLQLLAVRRPWRKRGLGKALLLHTFAEFRKRGKKRVGLGVDASNLTGALRLYENAGMYVARQYDRYEKELRPGKELMTTEIHE